MDLVLVLAILALLGSRRFLLGLQPPVRDEREGATVGREPRMVVVACADGQLARRAVGGLVGRDEPDGLSVAVERRGDALERDDRPSAVR